MTIKLFFTILAIHFFCYPLTAQQNTTATTPQAPPTRQIEYTVDEGTWISLDVSPDGQTIVFELVGDIYTLPIGGGEAKPLITGPAFQSQPRFSPDGQLITYISDDSGSDNVWTINFNGTNPQNITKLNTSFLLSPEWSADGRKIFVTAVDGQGIRSGGVTKGEAELWSYDLVTGQGSKLIGNNNGPASSLISSCAPGPYSAHVTADGRSLYYTSVRPRAAGSRNGALSHIMRRDLVTNTDERVWLDGSNAMKPLTSPDGQWLVYAAENRGLAGLKCRDLSSGNEFWLKSQMQRSELEARASRDVLPNYSFTPDSKFVIAAYGGKIHKLSLESKADSIIAFSAKLALQISGRIHFPTRMEEGPVQARVLQQLAVTDDNRAAVSTFGRIYLVDLATGSSKRLTGENEPREFMPAWSPDGKWLAFVTWNREGGHLWKISTTGDALPERISEKPGMYLDPVWSPDGSYLVALYTPLSQARQHKGGMAAPELLRSPNTELVRISAEGKNFKTLMRSENIRHPHFVMNSSRIYLTGPEGLISFNAEGKDKKIHVQFPSPGNTSTPVLRHFLISGDGSSILLLTTDKLFKMAAPSQENYKPNLADKNTVRMLSDLYPRSIAWSPTGKNYGWIVGNTIYSSAAKATTPVKNTSVKIQLHRDSTAGVVVLRGAKAITMKDHEIIEKSDIVIYNNRISAITREGELTVPEDVKLIDITGKVVVPGFIDVHAHWPIRPELWEPENSSAYSNIAYGITTVRDAHNNPDIFGYADWESTGEIVSPRIYSTGPGILESHAIQSQEEARKLIKAYKDNYNSRFVILYLPGTRQQRQWLIQACREFSLMPIMEGGGDAKAVITHFLDGVTGNENTLSTQPMYQDLVQLLVRSGITYTPTLLVSAGAALPIFRVLAEEQPYRNAKVNFFFSEDVYKSSAKRMLWFADEDMNYKEAAEGVNAVMEAGGKIALGGHGEIQGISNHWEMRLISEGGMNPQSILKAATLNGAEALGFEDDLGSLEVGKLADLVILDKDPLENIRNTESIRYVMKNGKLYEGETLKQVWPEEKKLPPMWWHENK